MRKILLSSALFASLLSIKAQTNPAITSWLQNTTETSYVWEEGATELFDSEILVNCQQVEYSDDYAYITTTGVPAYPIGPFIGNPFGASDQEEIYKINLNPEENRGRLTETSAAGNAVFINGVLWYDYQDGVAWDNDAEALCGGDVDTGTELDESWYLRKEREGFRSLIKNLKTHKRVKHMLDIGKPLRN